MGQFREFLKPSSAAFAALPTQNIAEFAKFAEDPVGYAETVLGVHWWHKQVEVALSLLKHRRTFVKACHSVGKTHLAGGLVSWHYDCFKPSITKTTAPTKVQVVDLTWKEVRLQRRGRYMLPKAARIESYLQDGRIDPSHFAAGYTAKDADSFQGDHEEHLLVVFEEAVGINEQFWTATEGMLSSGPGNRWLAIMNPTDTTSRAYQEELSGDWNVITISALEHPNIEAELRNLPRPFPKAIALSWVEERIVKWCQVIDEADAKALDFCWPPKWYCEANGVAPAWYRPGPLFEGRVLGRWPSQSTDSVWSEAMWNAAIERKEELRKTMKNYPPEIGCDRARFGDDNTSIHARRGGVSLSHETYNGWDTTRTLHRLKERASEVGNDANVEPKRVLVKVDDFQGGVVDTARADGWNFVDINSSSKAIDEEGFPNRRSELWFAVADRADSNGLDFADLPDDVKAELRRQFMAPKWWPNGRGQREVEPKMKTKSRIKRSPDDADAVNLAFAPPPPGLSLPTVGPQSLGTRKNPFQMGRR